MVDKDRMIESILRKYSVPDNVKAGLSISSQQDASFVERLSIHITERSNTGTPIDIDCITSLMAELCESDEALSGLIACIPRCVGSGKALCTLFDMVRNGIAAASNGDSTGVKSYVPIKHHRDILEAVTEFAGKIEPPHIALPGDKDSYVQVSAIPLPLSRAYTVSMWVKLSQAGQSKGFLLYRYRSAGSGVDAIISACTQDASPGTWNLTIRSSCDKKGVRDEVQCRPTITVGEWHLITVRQTAMADSADSVSVAVDGVSVLEAELLYPFTTSVNESIWIFGLGLRGSLTSISLYAQDLPPTLVQLLHGFGPHVPNLTVGARCPQSSFDTGHLILGTMCAKGNLAAKLCQYTPIFSVTPVKATADARIPLVTPGVLYSDHIDLQPRVAEHDEPLLCTLTGACTVRSLTSGIDIWQDAGGCAVVMYLFWSYCDLNCTPAKSAANSGKSPTNLLEDATSPISSKPLLEYSKEGILGTMRLIALLISTSTDFKEQFVQCHGFHVIGYCLSMMPDSTKRVLIDDALIDACFDLVSALGPDAERGDGISAAMQGLLFDFRIWGACQLPALRHYLQRLSALLVEVGSLVYKCIGVQRILDIFRLHIARKLSIGTNGNGATAGRTAGAEGKSDAALSPEECSLEVADSMHRLLIIAVDAAQSFAVRNKTTVTADAEALLRCLEETNNVVIAERILRIVGSLRLSAPHSLKAAFHSVRFSDTAIIPLLSKKGFSMEVRSGALCNLLWVWGEDVKQLPSQIIPARKILNQLVVSLSTGPAGAPSHRKSVVAADATRTKALTEQITDFIKPIERCWVNLSMVGEVLRAAMTDGLWGKIAPSVFVPEAGAAARGEISGADLLEYVVPTTAPAVTTASAAAAANSAPAADVSALIRVIMHSGQLDSWMQVPLLPALLARCDLNTYCSMLMSMNVMFKTDDSQCEALSCLPTGAWLKTFLELAVMSEKAAIFCENEVPAKEAAAAAAAAAAAQATDSDFTVAATCTELALDCVSIVLEYKTRTQLLDTRPLWQTFQNVVHNACVLNFGESKLAEDIECSFLRRVVSLLLHRIANNGEQWVPHLIARTVHIFAMVESRKLFGASDQNTVASSVAKTPRDSSNLLNLDAADLVDSDSPQEVRPTPTEKLRQRNKVIQETNIICFIFDISNSLRKSAERGALQGLEWKALKIALRITLAALDTASERVADRIMQEILAQLKYMSERWAPITGNGYKSTLMVILTTLKEAIQAESSPEYLRGRYSALVFGIMHSFIEIRHLAASGGTISQQLLPALDALMGIDSCNDINLIFKLLDVTMRKADAISFEEVEVQDDSTGDSPRSELAPSSESYIALNREKFSPDDDKLLKLPSEGEESSADYHDLPAEGGSDNVPEASTPLTESTLPSVGGGGDAKPSGTAEAADRAGTKLPIPPAVNVPGGRQPSNFSTYAALSEATHREAHFKQWLSVRQGISTERVDSERARLARSMDTLDLTSMATKKFWKKARRKVESESFLQTHACQWKLGVAHEGPFFGRRRVVLRPRFDSHYGHVVDRSDMAEHHSSVKEVASPHGDQLSRALATACAGYIKDVTRSEAVDASVMERDGKAAPTNPPGSGWGLVDVDGSDEGGFGVVGIAVADSTPAADDGTASTADGSVHMSLLPDDMQGDVRQLEENFKQGKGTETGPCHSGTRRVGSGPALLEAKVILITASGNFTGVLSFNGKEIFFASTFEAEDHRADDSAAVNLVKQRRMRRRRWVLSSVSGIYMRRFRLRDSAMEVFFKKGKHRNFFVDFGHTKDDARQRNEFARAFMTAAPPTAFKQVPSMSAQRLVYEHKVQEKWLEGKMGNFDYLMALNTLAGRSYNDLCQYPVFPWVLCDYTSAEIDLSDEKVYRDLSKPMGALNENRLREFLDRFNTFEENVTSGIPAFMYGSHYSTMVGVVLHFLVRLQPFAALHKEMQNGHFDVPDRLFSSIPRSFRHNTTQLSEVKELTPEWYTTPDMFRNLNGFQLGQTQDGDMVDDVELPPWAATPEEFVRINRAALESDFVSAHLHEWIDLIFGYKQRGPDSIEANNVFYYLTYYGSVNHYMIKDEALRRATELQIAHFGQTPMQLFKTPHPAKKVQPALAKEGVPRPLRKCFSSLPASIPTSASTQSVPDAQPGSAPETPRSTVTTTTQPTSQLAMINGNDEEVLAYQAPCTLMQKVSSSRVIRAEVLVDRLLCVLDSGVVEVLKYGTSEAAKAALVLSQSRGRHREGRRGESSKAGGIAAEESSRGATDLIILDELYDPFAELQREQELLEAAREASAKSSGDQSPSSAAVFAPRQLMGKQDCLISVERDLAHFDIIPRVPLARPYKAHWKAALLRMPGAAELATAGLTPDMLLVPTTQQLVTSMVFSRSCSLLVTAGHVDGRVAVREIDNRTGFVKASADFTAHRRRVITLSTDAIPSGNTDVMATCDEAGIVMVWTILRTKNEQLGSVGYVVSRRPQRLFRCDPQPDMFCEISWQMGVVAVTTGTKVCVFSIERDELIKTFFVDISSPPVTKDEPVASPRSDGVAHHHPSRVGCASAYTSSTGGSAAPPSNAVCRRMVLSDYAVVVLHVECFSAAEDLLGNSGGVTSTHYIVTTTLSGCRSGLLQCHAPVTFMSCPDRNEYLVLGYSDGTVQICCALSLTVLFSFQPHLFAVEYSPIGSARDPVARADSSSREQAARRRTVAGGETVAGQSSAKYDGKDKEKPVAFSASPIVSVALGPNRAAPAVICVMTEAGNTYLKAMPDFVRWERVRMPSTLQQLAAVPMQAVKGTLMQAQNWTTETAGVLAQNARSLADDALGELRKLNKGKLAKGVASFFGMGKGSS